MKTISYFLSLLVLFIIYGFYLATFNFSPIPSRLSKESHSEFYDYKGTLNVHSNLSSGSSSPEEIISEAKKSGLDFIILTDQIIFEKNSQDEVLSKQGYFGNMLVLSESETSFLDMRLLHLKGANDSIPDQQQEARVYLTDLISQESAKDRDNVVIVAHPFRDGPTWSGNFPTGVDGLEILNPKSMSHVSWITNKLNVIWSLFCYPFNPELAFLRLFHEPTEEISLWDSMLKKYQIFGFSGADASAKAIPFASYFFKFPSYQKSFEISSNHILLDSELNGNFQKDRATIISAFKNGQFYFSLDLLGDPKGFTAHIQDSDKIHMLGSKIKFNKNLKLISNLPLKPTEFFEIVVLKDGERISTSNSRDLNFKIPGPGIYRIEVRVIASLPLPDAKKWMTWIYTNPFFIY